MDYFNYLSKNLSFLTSLNHPKSNNQIIWNCVLLFESFEIIVDYCKRTCYCKRNGRSQKGPSYKGFRSATCGWSTSLMHTHQLSIQEALSSCRQGRPGKGGGWGWHWVPNEEGKHPVCPGAYLVTHEVCFHNAEAVELFDYCWKNIK